MPEVLSRSGVPIVTDFAGGRGTPFVVNHDNGRGYVLRDDNEIVPIGGNVYDARDYGVSPSASAATNAAGLQAMINDGVTDRAATFYLPVGEYDYNVGLVQAPSSGQTHLNWLGLGGAGASGVVLNYTGAGGTALTIKNNTRFSLRNLFLSDGGSGAVGLLITSLASGSSTGPGILENIFISGFTKNYVVGESGGQAASELVHVNLEVSNGSSHGVEINAANSLNCVFYHFNMSSNAVGMEAVDPDNVYIYGGSATANTTQDFAFRQAGAFGIYGYRSEGGNRFLTVGPDGQAGAGSPSNITVANCRIAATGASDNRTIRLHKAGQYSIHNNHIQDGHISLLMANTVSAYVEIKGNLVISSSLYEFEDSNTVTCEVEARGNRSSTASSANYWPDEHIIQNASTANYISSIDLTTPTAPIVKRSHTVIATASLPAAATSMDGSVLIEDAGAGDRNLILYAGGQRFRIDGGAAF